METKIQPRYEFRIFGNNLSKYEDKIKRLSKKEKWIRYICLLPGNERIMLKSGKA